jgi:hypothetical protein
MSQFSTDNTSRGNWGIMNSGRNSQYAILKPGEHTAEMVTFKTQQTNWQTIIQLWQRYKDDGTSMTDLQALVDAVKEELRKYPYIGDTGDTVVDAAVIAVRETLETPAGAPKWLYVELIGMANEQEKITFSE